MSQQYFSLFNPSLQKVSFHINNDVYFGTDENGYDDIKYHMNSKVINADVNDSDFLIKLNVSVSPIIDNQKLFSLQVEYESGVRINQDAIRKEFEDEAKKEAQEENYERIRKIILKKTAPEIIYNSLRNIVWNITQESEFNAIMLPEFDSWKEEQPNEDSFNIEDSFDEDEDPFDEEYIWEDEASNTKDEKKREIVVENYKRVHSKYVMKGKKSVDVNSVPYPLGYKWMLAYIQKEEELLGFNFLQLYQELLGNDLQDYKELPVYQYYLRFFVPIEYHHKEFSECEEDFWPLLFQMIFASCDNTSLIKGKQGLPELCFSLPNSDSKKVYMVSDLSLEQLTQICANLSSLTFVQIATHILCLEVNDMYALSLDDNGEISLDDMKNLFNYDSYTDVSEYKILIQGLHQNIQHCKEKSAPFIN